MGSTHRDMPDRYVLPVDIFSLTLSFVLTSWILYGRITQYWIKGIYSIGFSILILVYIAVFFLFDSHTRLLKRGFMEELLTVMKAAIIVAVILTVVMYVFQEGAAYSRLFFFLNIIFNILFLYLSRQYFKMAVLSLYKNGKSGKKIMILTTYDQTKKVLKRFREENDWEYQITYLTILDREMTGEHIQGIEVRARQENMYEIAKQEVVDEVFIHVPEEGISDLEEIILKFQNMGITTNLSIYTFGLKIHEKRVRQMSGYHVLTFSSRIFEESQMLQKRMLDILGGLTGCILTIFLILILAPMIRLESKGPIFFSQVRVGRNGRRFKIYKFRSMYSDAEERLAELMEHNEMSGHMFKMKDDPRITKVGYFLRKTSLDEFPQFFNVLKGDMSLVGTRPPTEREFLQYEERHKRRLVLKSGVTGLWQVSGRSDINDFEDVVKLDLEYIDNWSIGMDIKILFKTLGVVLLRRGSR